MGYFIDGLADVLKKIGLELQKISDENDEHGRYYVLIDGIEYEIYSALQSNNSWRLAFRRTLEVVNELLEKIGTKERLYGCVSGDVFDNLFDSNDGNMVLLTDELVKVIKDNQLFSKTRIFLSTEL